LLHFVVLIVEAYPKRIIGKDIFLGFLLDSDEQILKHGHFTIDLGYPFGTDETGTIIGGVHL
jgi:hypothetical protein